MDLEDQLESPSFLVVLANIPDPRREKSCYHKISDIVGIVFICLLCKVENFTDMPIYVEARLNTFKKFFDLSAGIPSHATLNRVFRIMKPATIEACFREFMEKISKALQNKQIAMDGKTLRGSASEGNTPQTAKHVLQAYATDLQLVLGQIPLESKGGELQAMLQMLDLISVEGCLVTADAAACYRDVCDKVCKGNGDYLFPVKENQPKLLEGVKEALAESLKDGTADVAVTEPKKNRNGSETTKEYVITTDIDELGERHDWPQLAAVGSLTTTKRSKKGTKQEVRYFILSKGLTAENFSGAVSAHWSIEAGLHHVLDVQMNEDRCQVSQGHAPENLALIRRFAFNALKASCLKGSFNTKRLSTTLVLKTLDV